MRSKGGTFARDDGWLHEVFQVVLCMLTAELTSAFMARLPKLLHSLCALVPDCAVGFKHRFQQVFQAMLLPNRAYAFISLDT